jgi:hypothetical protein
MDGSTDKKRRDGRIVGSLRREDMQESDFPIDEIMVFGYVGLFSTAISSSWYERRKQVSTEECRQKENNAAQKK